MFKNLKINSFIKNFKLKISNSWKSTTFPGQIVILPLILLVVVMVLITSMFSRVTNFVRSGSRSVQHEQAVALAEAGIDYAVLQINLNTNYAGNQTKPLPESGTPRGEFKVENITGSLDKKITVKGCIPDCTNPKVQRTVKVEVTNKPGFNYALHTMGGEPREIGGDEGSKDGLEWIGDGPGDPGTVVYGGDIASGGKVRDNKPCVDITQPIIPPPSPLPANPNCRVYGKIFYEDILYEGILSLENHRTVNSFDVWAQDGIEKVGNNTISSTATLDESLWLTAAQQTQVPSSGFTNGQTCDPSAWDSGTINLGPYFADIGSSSGNCDEVSEMNFNGKTIYLMGPLYVDGNITFENSTINLDNSLGSASTAILAVNGGKISLINSTVNTNSANGYILFYSDNTSSTQSIYINDERSAANKREVKGVFLAPYGRATIEGKPTSVYPIVKVRGAVSVWDDLEIKGTEFTFDPALKNATYTGLTFPPGSWQIKRGTYKISL